MKPRDKNGVVDSRLNVYGVRNLKVAGKYRFPSQSKPSGADFPGYSDCSIAPSNVGSNTYNTALIIGEKAAVIIAEDLAIGTLGSHL